MPGTEFLYSTHGFTVLAAIIEKVTGVPFDKVGINLNTMIRYRTLLKAVFRIRFFFPDSDQTFFLSPYPDRPKIRILPGIWKNPDPIRKNPDP